MGCNSSNNRVLNQRLNEFELKQHSRVLYMKSEEVTLYMPQHRVGDYYAIEIGNRDYYYFEDRFKELVSRELAANKTELMLASKEAFITSILRNGKLRKAVLRIVRRKGLMHAYRWKTWYLLATYDNRFRPDGPLLTSRLKLYDKLNQKRDKEVEDIVTKDVMRTARHKELFKDIDSVGSTQLYRVCKAVGKFFPACGYIQGMNFIAAFLLQVNGMDEFEAFNFMVSFWKKEKNLFYGMYEPGFPVLYFMNYAFTRFLELTNRKVHRAVQKLGFPAELWIIKWFLSFFTFSVEKEFVLRIFDFLVVNDVFGPVYVALAIANQLTALFETEDFVAIGEVVQHREKLTAAIDFHKFVKTLKQLDFDQKFKLSVLRDYNKTLDGEKKTQFAPFFAKFERHFMKSELSFFDDFNFDANCNDFDKIGVSKLTAMIVSERDLPAMRIDMNTKENDKRKSDSRRDSVLRKLKSETIESSTNMKVTAEAEELPETSFFNMR